MRLIDADALKVQIHSRCDVCNDKDTAWCEHCCSVNDWEDYIDNAPTIEEQPKGEWFKELLRLQSLEYHGDTFESGGYLFSYHEMMGLYTISVIETSIPANYKFTLESAMSHDEFVKWCKDWMINRKEGSNDR